MSVDERKEQQFQAAVKVIQGLPKNGSFKPSNELMLRFYALYKQATVGPCNAAKPSFWDVVGKAKWDAWSGLNQMTQIEAMEQYVAEIKQTIPNVCSALGIDVSVRRDPKIVEMAPQTETVLHFLDQIGPFYEVVPLKHEQSDAIQSPAEITIQSQSPAEIYIQSQSPAERAERLTTSHVLHTAGRKMNGYRNYITQERHNDNERIDLNSEAKDREVETAATTATHASVGQCISNYHNGTHLSLDNEQSDDENIDRMQAGPQQLAAREAIAAYSDPPSLSPTEESDTDSEAYLDTSDTAFHLNGLELDGLTAPPDRIPHPTKQQKSVSFMLPKSHIKEESAHTVADTRVAPADVSEQLQQALLNLQLDVAALDRRLNVVEQLVIQQRKRELEQAQRSSWWPFTSLDTRSTAVLFLWPVAVAWFTYYMAMRRKRQ